MYDSVFGEGCGVPGAGNGDRKSILVVNATKEPPKADCPVHAAAKRLDLPYHNHTSDVLFHARPTTNGMIIITQRSDFKHAKGDSPKNTPIKRQLFARLGLVEIGAKTPRCMGVTSK
jgi:hypothetical protein